VPGRRAAAPNPAGAHFLHDRVLIGQLVRASGARRGSLVFDLGAGHGALTTALAGAGARVIAVERDHRLARGLRRRAAGNPLVRVVEDDLRQIPLPRQEFLVVANIPFSVTAVLLRRLAGDPAVPLAGAELIISWGAARGLTSAVPRHAEAAWWAVRYRMRIARRVPPHSFRPPPTGDAAHLSIRPRPLAASPSGQRLLRRLLRARVCPAAPRPVQADPPAGVQRAAQDDLRQDPPGGTPRPGNPPPGHSTLGGGLSHGGHRPAWHPRVLGRGLSGP
jgi:23S rRNA (adenine-N6)-dimethyltransferase